MPENEMQTVNACTTERAIRRLFEDNPGKHNNISFRHHVQLEIQKAIDAGIKLERKNARAFDPVKEKLKEALKYTALRTVAGKLCWCRTPGRGCSSGDPDGYCQKATAALSEKEEG